MNGSTATTTVVDSTVNGNNGTKSSSQPIQGTGRIDGGYVFDNTSGDAYYAPSSASLPTADFSYEFWIYSTGISSAQGNTVPFNVNNSILMEYNNDDTMHVWTPGGGTFNTTSAISLNQWHLISYTRIGSSEHVYIDGVADATTNSDSTAINYGSSCAESVTIGADFGSCTASDGFTINGSLDEFRVSDIARSSTWVKTEYNNQSTPASFETFGLANTQGQSGVDSINIGHGTTINHGVSLSQ